MTDTPPGDDPAAGDDELWSDTRPSESPASPTQPELPLGPEWVSPSEVTEPSEAAVPGTGDVSPEDPAWRPVPYDAGRDEDEPPVERFPWLILTAFFVAVAIAAGIVAIVAGSDDEGDADAPTSSGSPTGQVTSLPTGTGFTNVTGTTSADSGRATNEPGTDISFTSTTRFGNDSVPTTTSVAPTTTEALAPNRQAELDLERRLDDDFDTVSDLDGSWVVQLSAKQQGTEADGIRYRLRDVLRNHEQLRDQYGAVLLWSSDWGYQSQDYYVTVIPTAYGTAAGALDECRRLGIDRENCLAKKLTTDPSETDTVEYLP